MENKGKFILIDLDVELDSTMNGKLGTPVKVNKAIVFILKFEYNKIETNLYIILFISIKLSTFRMTQFSIPRRQ